MMIEVSAPGKIMIAGEWAVLEKDHPAVVAAVDRRARVRLESSPDSDLHFDLPDFGIADLSARWESGFLAWGRKISPREKKGLRFVSAAVEVVLSCTDRVLPFRLESSSGTFDVFQDGLRRKLGFGSSASVVVAAVAGLLRFQGLPAEEERDRDSVLRFSILAHTRAQGGIGSGFDVASSTYGGVLVYRRADPAWLASRLEEGRRPADMVEEKWPGLSVESPGAFPDLHFSAGWTGGSASTPDMIRRIDRWRREGEDRFLDIADRIRDVVLDLVEAWRGGDGSGVLRCVTANRELLRELGEASGVDIESAPLRDLSDAAEAAGGAGKPSGAGGADIGIALCLDSSCMDGVRRAWEEKGIVPIPVEISPEGYRVETTDSNG